MADQGYYFLRDNKPVGPVSSQQLKEMAASNQLKPQDLVCPVGGTNWVPASQIADLFAATPIAPPAAVVPQPVPAGTPTINRDALLGAAMAGFEAGVSGQPVKPAGPDLVAMAKSAGVWLGTTVAGTGSIAALGLLFLCCGGCGVAICLSNPSAPTKVAIAELEKSSKPPPSNWLEIEGGNAFWPEMVRDITEVKKSDKVEKSTTAWYYVPLASSDVIDTWTTELNRAGANSKFPYDKARVFLKVSPASMKKDFPEAESGKPASAAQRASPVAGTVGNFRIVPDHVMKRLKANATDQDPERMILLNYREEIPSSGVGICSAICMWIVAFTLFVPLVLVLIKRRRTL